MDIREKVEEREHLGRGTYFVWVKGHANDEGNGEADRLAVQGAKLGRGVNRDVDYEQEVEKVEILEEMEGENGDIADTMGENEGSEVEEAFREMERVMGGGENGQRW